MSDTPIRLTKNRVGPALSSALFVGRDVADAALSTSCCRRHDVEKVCCRRHDVGTVKKKSTPEVVFVLVYKNTQPIDSLPSLSKKRLFTETVHEPYLLKAVHALPKPARSVDNQNYKLRSCGCGKEKNYAQNYLRPVVQWSKLVKLMII